MATVRAFRPLRFDTFDLATGVPGKTKPRVPLFDKHDRTMHSMMPSIPNLANRPQIKEPAPQQVRYSAVRLLCEDKQRLATYLPYG